MKGIICRQRPKRFKSKCVRISFYPYLFHSNFNPISPKKQPDCPLNSETRDIFNKSAQKNGSKHSKNVPDMTNCNLEKIWRFCDLLSTLRKCSSTKIFRNSTIQDANHQLRRHLLYKYLFVFSSALSVDEGHFLEVISSLLKASSSWLFVMIL